MEEKTCTDALVVHDRAGRRRFIRTGSAFLLTGGLVATVGNGALASECDRGRGQGAGQKKPEDAGNGSDSDSGANGDPIGCGRRYHEKPKISMSSPIDESEKTISVDKIVT
ncbi:MAG: hypothetical protein AB8B79_14270 [Granulosicoccus sp.]